MHLLHLICEQIICLNLNYNLQVILQHIPAQTVFIINEAPNTYYVLCYLSTWLIIFYPTICSTQAGPSMHQTVI